MLIVAGAITLDGSKRAAADAAFEKMRAAYSDRDLHKRPAEVLFPPTFPAFS